MENLKSILAEKLSALAGIVSASEKVEAMKFINISEPTLYKYLSGDMEKIAKVDTATELIEFFSKKVNERIEKIRATNLV